MLTGACRESNEAIIVERVEHRFYPDAAGPLTLAPR